MKINFSTVILLAFAILSFKNVEAQTEIDVSPNGKTYSQLF